ncbi:MAG: zf-HC2 domain-containing protein [Anaerolineales bacterium]|nr:zf-HC2 domain-containing protein [Anaerolineales bacterium]
MFDWIRNLTKSAAEKQQELLTAYVDDELTPAERQRFEQMMAGDELLRAEMERQRLFKRAIQELPRVAAPRNFILNPADYRAPAPQRAIQLYPALRAATALAALFLIFIVSTSLLNSGGAIPESASDIAFVPTDNANLASGAAESAPMEATEIAPAEAVAAESAANDESGAAADSAAAEEVVEEMAEEAEADFFYEETVTPAATPSMAGAAVTDTEESAAAEEGGTAGEDEAAAPRPSATDTQEPRAQQAEPVATEVAATERIAATETPAGQITISPTSSTAPPDIPWLPLITISLFVLLLAATLVVRWHKNKL